MRGGLAAPRVVVGQGRGGADEKFLGGVESPDAAGLDGPRLPALRRLLLLPENGADERRAPEDILHGVVPRRPVVLRHVAVRVGRDRPDQRLRGLKRQSEVNQDFARMSGKSLLLWG